MKQALLDTLVFVAHMFVGATLGIVLGIIIITIGDFVISVFGG